MILVDWLSEHFLWLSCERTRGAQSWAVNASHESERLVLGSAHPAQRRPGRHRVCAWSAPDEATNQTRRTGALASDGVRERPGHSDCGSAVTNQHLRRQAAQPA